MVPTSQKVKAEANREVSSDSRGIQDFANSFLGALLRLCMELKMNRRWVLEVKGFFMMNLSGFPVPP